MAINAIEMRRILLGEDSKFIESLAGRITMVVLATALAGVAMSMLFLVNDRLPNWILKACLVASVGLMAGFMARRILVGRHFFFRLLVSIFAVAIALGLLNVLTRGYIGINLLRAYPSRPAWDGALQFFFAALVAWAVQTAWAGTRREVMVEPRWVPAETSASQPAVPRARRAVRAGSESWLRNAGLAWSRVRTRALTILTPPAARTRSKTRKTRASSRKRNIFSARHRAVHLTSEEEHRCPYCLELVRARDPRGVKVCKVCKTWHHGDCWAVTGVCQVPHQYVN